MEYIFQCLKHTSLQLRISVHLIHLISKTNVPGVSKWQMETSLSHYESVCMTEEIKLLKYSYIGLAKKPEKTILVV